MVGNVKLQFAMHQRLTKLTHSHILRFSWVSRCFKAMSNSCPLVHSLKLSRGTTKPKDLPRWPHCGTQVVQLGALCKSSGRCQKTMLTVLTGHHCAHSGLSAHCVHRKVEPTYSIIWIKVTTWRKTFGFRLQNSGRNIEMPAVFCTLNWRQEWQPP